MTIVITGEDRDALYERIVMRLNGIDDVYRAVEQEDWASAQELGLEFSDLLRSSAPTWDGGRGRTRASP